MKMIFINISSDTFVIQVEPSGSSAPVTAACDVRNVMVRRLCETSWFAVER